MLGRISVRSVGIMVGILLFADISPSMASNTPSSDPEDNSVSRDMVRHLESTVVHPQDGAKGRWVGDATTTQSATMGTLPGSRLQRKPKQRTLITEETPPAKERVHWHLGLSNSHLGNLSPPIIAHITSYVSAEDLLRIRHVKNPNAAGLRAIVTHLTTKASLIQRAKRWVTNVGKPNISELQALSRLLSAVGIDGRTKERSIVFHPTEVTDPVVRGLIRLYAIAVLYAPLGYFVPLFRHYFVPDEAVVRVGFKFMFEAHRAPATAFELGANRNNPYIHCPGFRYEETKQGHGLIRMDPLSWIFMHRTPAEPRVVPRLHKHGSFVSSMQAALASGYPPESVPRVSVRKWQMNHISDLVDDFSPTIDITLFLELIMTPDPGSLLPSPSNGFWAYVSLGPTFEYDVFLDGVARMKRWPYSQELMHTLFHWVATEAARHGVVLNATSKAWIARHSLELGYSPGVFV